MSEKPVVAIIGAGPGGTTLARLLHLAKVPYVLYEGEHSPQFRSQGSTLDLHHDTGLAALKKADLWAEFEENARYDSEATAIVNKDYLIYMKSPPGDKMRKYSRPEIDRTELRKILLNSLPEGSIKWGHHLKSVGEDGTLTFADQGTHGPFELVVGADGAWSKVRPLLTDERPYHVGIGGIGVSISDPATHCPELMERLRKGSLFAFSDFKAICPQQLGSGNINCYAWFKAEEDWMDKVGFDPAKDHDAIQDYLYNTVFHDWHPRLKDYIMAGNEEHDPRNMYMLPVGIRWEHRKGIAIIGDAAHLMTPFAGEGVNLAMADAMAAGEAIAEGVKAGDLDGAMKKFEEEMFVRAKDFQQLTKRNLDGFFSDDPKSIQRTVNGMLERFKPRIPPQLYEYLDKQNQNPRQGP